MADNTTYRDPSVTTTTDDTHSSSSTGNANWLKWALVAFAVLIGLWLLLSLFTADDDGVRVVNTENDTVAVEPDNDAVEVEEGATGSAPATIATD